MVHCGICDWCIVGFEKQLRCFDMVISQPLLQDCLWMWLTYLSKMYICFWSSIKRTFQSTGITRSKKINLWSANTKSLLWKLVLNEQFINTVWLIFHELYRHKLYKRVEYSFHHGHGLIFDLSQWDGLFGVMWLVLILQPRPVNYDLLTTTCVFPWLLN